jgi:hypothetical protein
MFSKFENKNIISFDKVHKDVSQYLEYFLKYSLIFLSLDIHLLLFLVWRYFV